MKVRSSTENRKFDPSEIKVQIISPVASDDEFWKLYGEKYASILTVGIMAKLLEDAPFICSFICPCFKSPQSFWHRFSS